MTNDDPTANNKPDDAATEVLSTTAPTPTEPGAQGGLSRRLLLIFGGIAALLVVIIILLVVLLLQRSSETEPIALPSTSPSIEPSLQPSAEATPSAEPSASVTPEPSAPPATNPPVSPPPRITSFTLDSSPPRSLCGVAGATSAVLEFSWASTVQNNLAELRWDSPTGNLLVGSLPSNGSTPVTIPCTSTSDITVVLVVKGSGNTQDSWSIPMLAPAAPRIDSLTVSVYNPALGTLMQQCLEETKPGGSRQVLVRLSYSTTNVASVSFTRVAQPGSQAGNVGSSGLATSGTHLTVYSCGWTSVVYTLTAVGQDGSTTTRTTSISG